MLAMLGLCGTVIASLQAYVLEGESWKNLLSSAHSGLLFNTVVFPLVTFSLALYVFYVSVPLVLIWGGATLLNLSLLTSDLWGALSRIVFFGGFGGSGIYFAFALVAETIGLLVYATAGSTFIEAPSKGSKDAVASEKPSVGAPDNGTKFEDAQDISEEQEDEERALLSVGKEEASYTEMTRTSLSVAPSNDEWEENNGSIFKEESALLLPAREQVTKGKKMGLLKEGLLIM
eukprot:CAMPEP_0175083214 /NCGR_PEP_ID=MMETSP0052_2-20121109/27226_1 /TAXON_ID=51329 ORGANISM="Polytomella parva, Strain SAG 63-3" /NCGR_SAMPLE_ID=MMETSP0052_2 /ASSEMBLY_ACC=CAM_ASM_000194 /LENGTH=231 /DNA_ID=CAMNT_0016354575 /DNA_START=481 /DNA_END=1176 /DNA_ORIENTATION=+